MELHIRINGRSVRVSSVQRRAIGLADGSHQEELRITAIVQGLPEQRAFLDLLAQRPLHLEFPHEGGWSAYDAEIITAAHTEIGYPGGFTYRHTLSMSVTNEPGATWHPVSA